MREHRGKAPTHCGNVLRRVCQRLRNARCHLLPRLQSAEGLGERQSILKLLSFLEYPLGAGRHCAKDVMLWLGVSPDIKIISIIQTRN